ncbi:MAG TPA: DMT family transporter [Prolixibacteraceae bacterium]|nr:DMT family transporter [Prolixibacteraceae bacterium]HPS11853.1 DMT family transporter [Prolixibacteraceae bacterium]
MWGILGIVTAVLLGIYDIFKKVSLNNNAVLPVLLVSVATSSLFFFPVVIGSRLNPVFFQSINLYAPKISPVQHLEIFAKSIIVLSSWILAFFAIKHLPLTVVSPIRATEPLWTLIGALIIFSEKLNAPQWIGLTITLSFFYLFSTTGKLEGINFKKNKWIFLIIGATLLGSASGLWDKFIVREIDRLSVQVWSGIYQLLILSIVVAVFWYPTRKKTTPFQWRWTIPFIGIFLVFSDFVYFYALSYPESLISVLSGIRRSGVVISFIFAALFFKESNILKKGLYLAGIITGVLFMALGSN